MDFFHPLKKNIQKHVPGTNSRNIFYESRWTAMIFHQTLLNFQKWSEKKGGYDPPGNRRVCNTSCIPAMPHCLEKKMGPQGSLFTPAGYHTPENQHDNRKPNHEWRCAFPIKTGDFFIAMVMFSGGFKKKNIDTLTGSSSLGWVSSTHKAFHCAKFSAICVDTSAKIWELLSR